MSAVMFEFIGVLAVWVCLFFLIFKIWNIIKKKYSERYPDDKSLIDFGILLTFFAALKITDTIPDLFVAILKASEVFLFGFIILTIWLLKDLLKKRNDNGRLFYICYIFIFLLSMPCLPKVCGYKTTQIGSFYEANEYTEKYYVFFSIEPKQNSREVYKLPALIERREDFLYTISSDYNDRDVYEYNYHISKLYLSDNSTLQFDCDDKYSILSPNKEMKVYSDGLYYYITLTEERAD